MLSSSYADDKKTKNVITNFWDHPPSVQIKTKTISKKKRIILQTIHLKYNNGTNKENESHLTKKNKKDGCKRKIG